ncbi:phosphomannomutase/phosphoglucomutase [Candidatus Peregrinibacteria bacterium]|nr:phosphomannomutase/phosphoglucomutase [Candidatus Peregrinibacteria bacterium]
MDISSAIFRAYDIRGTVPGQLNAEAAHAIGCGFALFLIREKAIPHPRIVVGRDNRTHGEALQQAFIKGLITHGCDVTDIGLAATPLLYFAATVGHFDAGCNVSASHNPAEYNGFKLVGKNAHAIFGEDLQMIYKMIKKPEGGDIYPRLQVQIRNASFLGAYLNKIKSLFPNPQGLKIVVDTGNGIAGKFYPEILEALGNTVIPLFTELDGAFPNHQPDPIVEKNLEDLKKVVIANKADVGIAFDGDGDRLGIVDEKGIHWNSDRLAMLYVQDSLARTPKSRYVFTVSNSQLLFDMTEQWGGKAHMCPVGHSFVEEAMTKEGAILGGEQSGHFFLSENYFPYDDAIVAAGRLLEIMRKAGKPLSEQMALFPKTIIAPEIRPYCSDETKFKIIEKIKTHFLKEYPSGNILDGIRIDFGNSSWAGIRVSNTSPCLSICMEATNEKELQNIQDKILGHLRIYNEIKF